MLTGHTSRVNFTFWLSCEVQDEISAMLICLEILSTPFPCLAMSLLTAGHLNLSSLLLSKQWI